MTASALWTDVVANYESEGLINLTNPRDNGATAVVTAYGESAAQEVIDLFPIYGQVDYDATNSQHVTVGRRGVIAVLYERGGTSSTIAEVEWNQVFGDDGLITKLKRTSARARQGPNTNSGVRQKSELTSTGRRVRGWSDVDSLPLGRRWLPRRTIAED
ncbi:MAG: hypothetical protein GY882_11995 [Actinomycetia bacterium]|nr:hypothetical protein [Actinomycetes bacterium]